jgi:hypothetical protein
MASSYNSLWYKIEYKTKEIRLKKQNFLLKMFVKYYLPIMLAVSFLWHVVLISPMKDNPIEMFVKTNDVYS